MSAKEVIGKGGMKLTRTFSEKAGSLSCFWHEEISVIDLPHETCQLLLVQVMSEIWK